MGSSCSRVGRQGSSNRCDNSSSSRSFPQAYENSDSSAVYYRENVVTVDDEDVSLNIDLQSPFTSSNTQTDMPYQSSTDVLGNFSNGNVERNAEAYNQFALSESQQQHAYQSGLAVSQVGNLDNASLIVGDSDQSIDRPPLSNSLQRINSSHSVHDLESLSTDRQSSLNTENEDIVHNNSDVASRSLGSGSQGSPMTLYLLGFDSSRENTSLGTLDLFSRAEQDLGSGLHIDTVSISSNSLTRNIREMGTRELRSRGRRSFWDVLTRQNLTRHSDIPAFLLAIDDADDVGVHGRLVFDVNSDRQNDIAAHDWGTRSNNRFGQRQSRLERSESVHRGTIVEDRRRRLCASRLHQHGTCSCDSQFPGDEFGALVRISRIVILVEAINELLDEIHRQTMPFSVSTLSLPAPESIVNSLPLKNHKKLDMTDSSEEAQQCYICLAEYEEDDKIRVLPCKHEYHMPCVDKWLKEVHGICPLCRADVSVSSHPQSTDTEA